MAMVLIGIHHSAYAQSAKVSGTLETMLVSGARGERSPEDVPSSVDVLTDEALQAAGVYDIRDIAKQLPNVSVKRMPQRFGAVVGSTGRDGNAGFNIRGLEGNRILLSVDGIRVPRELASGVFGSASFGRDYYDLGLVSRVEVVRGASSALYGSDGLAGMVAMFTTDPQDLVPEGKTLGGRTRLHYDSEDGSRKLGLTLAGIASPIVQWLGSLQVGQSHELDSQGDIHSLNHTRTAPNPQEDKQYALLAKVVLTPGSGQKHTFSAEHINKRSEVEAYTGRTPIQNYMTGAVSGYITDLDGRMDMHRSRLSWDGRFLVDTPWADEWRSSIGFQRAETQEIATELRSVAPLSRNRDVTYQEDLWQGVLQAEKTRPFGKDWTQKLVYGLDVSIATLDNLVTGSNPPTYESYPLKRFPRTQETSAALFVQSEFASERWSVIPALRWDYYTLKPKVDTLYRIAATRLSDSALSPKLGVIFRPASEWSVFGNLAAGFKAPSPLQVNNFFENPQGNYKTIPNPDLKPETSVTLEVGARGQHGALDWEAVVFQGRYKDFIEELVSVGGSTRTPADPLRYQAINRGRVHLSGLELKGGWAWSKATRLRWAYGYTQGTDKTSGQPINSVNPAQLVLGADHRLGAWTWGAQINHVAQKDSKDINFSGTATQFATPSYTTVDLKAGWQFGKNTQLSLALNNILDKKYWDWANVKGVSANDAVLNAYTSPGRSFALALSHRF